MDPILLRIELFGGFRAGIAGRPLIDLPNQQATALLAYLALQEGKPVLREAVAEFFWPDLDPETGRRSLRQALYGLRALLKSLPGAPEGLLVAGRATVHLHPALLDTDVREFEERVLQASAERSPAERAGVLSEAERLYRGDLLPGFHHEPFSAPRLRLAELRLTVLSQLAAALEEAGDPDGAIETAKRALELDPLLEEAHCHLMRLYAAKGQPSGVVRQYQALERTLREELDTVPSEGTQGLMESLRENGRRVAASRALSSDPPDSEPVPDPPAPAPPFAPVSALRSRRPSGVLVLLVIGVLAALGTFLTVGGARRGETQAGAASPRAQEISAGGKELWIARYEGRTDDGDAEPTAILGDPHGNFYVTGFIRTTAHDVDFLTLKYSADGRLLWEARYNGPGNDVDRARALALDAEGNLYVTGDSDNGKGNEVTRLSGLDYATIKYSPSGEQLWVRRYNGPANGEDVPVQVVAGPSGQVYVTGRSIRGRTEADDIATVCYDAAGNLRWERRFDWTGGGNRPAAMALHPNGTLLVACSSQNTRGGWDSDAVLLCYGADGSLYWTETYDGPGRHHDVPRALALDAQGGIIVALRSDTGDPAVGGGHTDIVTLRYDPSGTLQWSRAYDGGKGLDEPAAINVAPWRDVLVTGASQGELHPEFITAAYDLAGNERWVRRFRGRGGGASFASALRSTRDGRVVVAGREFNRPQGEGGSENDFCLLQYTREGGLRWLRTYNGSGNGGDGALALTLDPSGLAVVTGQSFDGKHHNLVTIKYQP